jgi:TPR repeat protein
MPNPPPNQLRLPPTEIAALLARGDALFAHGDISSARLFYERAADAGEGRAALRLGNTFDPAFLEFAHLHMRGDLAMAESWYGRARKLGETEAEILLTTGQRHDQIEAIAAQHKIAPAEQQSAGEHFENVTTKN